jgi:hypothetical protein
MSELLSKFDSVYLIPLTAIVVGCLTGIICKISDNWRKVRVSEMEFALKQDMLQRGMSADEIDRVLAANSSGKRRSGRCGSWKTPSEAESGVH